MLDAAMDQYSQRPVSLGWACTKAVDSLLVAGFTVVCGHHCIDSAVW